MVLKKVGVVVVVLVLFMLVMVAADFPGGLPGGLPGGDPIDTGGGNEIPPVADDSCKEDSECTVTNFCYIKKGETKGKCSKYGAQWVGKEFTLWNYANQKFLCHSGWNPKFCKLDKASLYTLSFTSDGVTIQNLEQGTTLCEDNQLVHNCIPGLNVDLGRSWELINVNDNNVIRIKPIGKDTYLCPVDGGILQLCTNPSIKEMNFLLEEIDNDGDGVHNDKDKCPNSVIVNGEEDNIQSNGCMVGDVASTENNGVVNTPDNCVNNDDLNMLNGLFDFLKGKKITDLTGNSFILAFNNMNVNGDDIMDNKDLSLIRKYFVKNYNKLCIN